MSFFPSLCKVNGILCAVKRDHVTGIKKSLLLTYTKTLEAYLSQSALSLNEDASLAINRTYYWLSHPTEGYSEVIVDEAQDVRLLKYTVLKRITNSVSYGADFEQSLYLSNNELQELRTGLPLLFKNNKYLLDENFRNTNEVIQLVRSLFVNKKITHGNSSGPKPVLLNANGSIEKQKKAILDIINVFKSETHNIAILLPLKTHVNSYYDFITSNNIKCTRYYEGLTFNGIENVHITTFKSSKGTEFDTVIIPGFDKMRELIANMDVVEEEDYYVAITRVKLNLYLLCMNIPPFLSEKSLELCNIQIINEDE